AKRKVRQPLAEIKIQPANVNEEKAVRRFADQLKEELNIKQVSLHPPGQGPLIGREIKPNLKTLGPKFSSRLNEVLTALEEAVKEEPAWIAEMVEEGMPFDLPRPGGKVVTLDPTDVVVQLKAPTGWAGVADRGTQVMIDARITEDLAGEGMAREVVRHVQDLRKQSALEMEDRIVLYLGTESPQLRKAIEDHRDYICGETLAVELSANALSDDAHRAQVKVDGQPLTIELRKA